LFSVVFQSLVGFCFFWPRVCLLLFVYSSVVLNSCLGVCLGFVVWVARLSIAPHCLPLIPSNPPSPSAGPLPCGTPTSTSAVARRKPPPLKLPYGTPTTALGSAVGTPLGRAHRVVLPSPPTQPPHLWAVPGSVGPLSGRAPTIRWGVWERGGGFEGLQGGARGIGG